jgi:hypothetical protein
MTRARLLCAAMALLLAGARPAAAEHEVFYRYTVLGYVRDAAGRPVAGETIELVRDKTGFSYLAESDADGLFVIVARLGDESDGEALTLRTAHAGSALVVRLDAANHVDERGTRVDLEGGRFAEHAGWFASTLAAVIAAIATDHTDTDQRGGSHAEQGGAPADEGVRAHRDGSGQDEVGEEGADRTHR